MVSEVKTDEIQRYSDRHHRRKSQNLPKKTVIGVVLTRSKRNSRIIVPQKEKKCPARVPSWVTHGGEIRDENTRQVTSYGRGQLFPGDCKELYPGRTLVNTSGKMDINIVVRKMIPMMIRPILK